MNISRRKYLNRDKQPPGIIRDISTTNENVNISLLSYDSNNAHVKDINVNEIEDIKLDRKKNNWIHCNSTGNPDLLKQIGKKFDIHHLLLENIQNIDQRPRLNDTESFNFIVCKRYVFNNDELIKDHISIIFFPELVITFSDRNPFEDIKNRILQNQGKIRSKKTDYLLFSLLDLITDEYYSTFDILDQKVSFFEKELLDDKVNLDISGYIKLKGQIDLIKRNISPLPQIISGILSSKAPPILSVNIIYFRDLLNGMLQSIDIINSISDNINSILDLSINISSYRMNGIMKILTIISTTFIPLTFIAGIYGMNFHFMPELKIKWAYPAIVIVMVIIVINMFIFFKKKKWF